MEQEIGEKLNETAAKLLQAGVDRSESEREAKLRDTLQSLQKIFPGASILPSLILVSCSRMGVE